MGSKDSHWANLGQLTSDIFRAINPLAEILRNCSNLNDGSLYAIIDLLIGAKFIT